MAHHQTKRSKRLSHYRQRIRHKVLKTYQSAIFRNQMRISVKKVVADVSKNPESWSVLTVIYGDKTLFRADSRKLGKRIDRLISTDYYLKLIRNNE